MSPVLVIAGKDLRQRLRDRTAPVLGILAPLVVAALMSLAFHGIDNLHVTLGLVDADRGPVSAGVVSSLRSPALARLVTVRTYPSPSAAAEAVRARRVGAALVIPTGFSAAAASGGSAVLTTLQSVNAPIDGQVASAIATNVVARINADRLSVATALAAGAPVSDVQAMASAAARMPPPVVATQRALGAHRMTALSYYAPAMAMFFLLFLAPFTARSVAVERTEGLLERLRATPVTPVQIVLGKALSVAVYGAASMGTIIVATSLLFGADWGSPPAAAAVALVMVLAVVALAMVLVGFAKTEQQASGVGSVVVFGLALLGGNFLFISAEPPLMRSLALLTPNGWALRGYTDLVTTGGGLGTVAVPLLAMAAFTVVLGVVGALLAPRAVRS